MSFRQIRPKQDTIEMLSQAADKQLNDIEELKKQIESKISPYLFSNYVQEAVRRTEELEKAIKKQRNDIREIKKKI